MAKFGTKIRKWKRWGYKAKGGRVENHHLSFHFSEMSFTDSPSHCPFFADNVPMDIDSDAEAEQAALELAQAQERLRAAKEAQEKRREERKRQEEERKASTMVAIKLAAEQAAEMAVDRE